MKIILAAVLAAAGASASYSDGKKWTVTTEEAAKLPFKEALSRGITVSEDARHIGVLVEEKGNVIVFHNNTRLGQHSAVGGDRMVFSPDSAHLAYIAVEPSGSRVVIDGKPGEEWEMIQPESLVFSPSSDRLAYVASRKGKWFAVIGGVTGPAWDGILWNSLKFSEDGSRTVYGAAGPALAGLQADSIQFIPGSNRVAAIARIDDRWAVLIDGTPGTQAEGIVDRSLTFTPDGQHHAVITMSGGKSYAVFDGVQSNPYDSVDKLRITKDGIHFGFVALTEGKQFIVADEHEKKQFEQIYSFYLMASGEPVYSALDGNKVFVIHGEKRSQGYDSLSPLILSDNGKHYAFAGNAGSKATLVRDGVEGPTYDQIMGIVFSPDGERIAYHARKGTRWMSVIDGEEFKDSTITRTVLFSPEGRHTVSFSRAGKKWFACIDGERIKDTDDIGLWGQVAFEGPNLLRYIGLKPSKGLLFQRVTITQ